MDDQQAIERIYAALLTGELEEADLSARRLGAFLGRTTGAVYHRWGSLDGLLFAVSQRGFGALGSRMTSIWAATSDLEACAADYVTFGLEHPALYKLMFEHRFDWAGLRSAGAFERETPGSQLLAGIVCLLEQGGSKAALADTRLLMSGLHGIVSFTATGRMNTGDLASSDREVALSSARDLARRLRPARAIVAAQRKTPSPPPRERKSKTSTKDRVRS